MKSILQRLTFAGVFAFVAGCPLALEAAPFSAGVASGMEFPMWHTERLDPGVVAEAHFRVDPYEIRFHYTYVEAHYYTVLLGRKHFFSNDLLRPFVEVAVGPLILDTPAEGLSYGLSPVASLGAELGVNSNFSVMLATRYQAYLSFGDTASGNWEAMHSLGIVAGLTLWFQN